MGASRAPCCDFSAQTYGAAVSAMMTAAPTNMKFFRPGDTARNARSERRKNYQAG
jgi:hypothetical protein